MRKLIEILFTGSVIMFLISCTSYTVTPVPNPNETDVLSTPSTTDAVQLPTMTSTTLSVPSVTPEAISTATSFVLPTENLATLPTIPPDAVKSFVLELTNDNQNCLLPCFWNITPGETEWQNVEALLSTFAYSISYGAPDGTFSEIPIGNSFIAWMYLVVPEISNAPFSYAFDVRDGIVTMVDAFTLPVSNNTPKAILNEYGQPTEIWLLTANAPMDDVLGFSLTLFYAQHQFMLKYSNWDGEIIDGKVYGCLSGEEGPHLVTWSQNEDLTFAEANAGLHKPSRPIIYDLPLEEATEMSVETFYDTFKDANEPICLETPVDLWPGP